MRIRHAGLLTAATVMLLVLPFVVSATETTATCTTALLVIDVQNRWANDEEWRTTADGTFIVDKIVELLEHARGDVPENVGVPRIQQLDFD